MRFVDLADAAVNDSTGRLGLRMLLPVASLWTGNAAPGHTASRVREMAAQCHHVGHRRDPVPHRTAHDPCSDPKVENRLARWV